LRFYIEAPRDEYDHVTVVFLHHGQATMWFDKAQFAAFDD
jgi:hypothetical protein